MRRPRFLSGKDDFVPIEEQRSLEADDKKSPDRPSSSGESPTAQSNDGYSDDRVQASELSGQTFEHSGIRKASLNLSGTKDRAPQRETLGSAKNRDKVLSVPADTAGRADSRYDRSVPKKDIGYSARTYTMRPDERISKDESDTSGKRIVSDTQTDSRESYPPDQEMVTKKKNVKGDPKSASKKRKNRTISRILTLLAVLCFALGFYFLILPSIVHKNQDNAAQELLDKLKKQEEAGETGVVEITVKAGDVNAPGSFSPEYDVILRPGETLSPDSPAFTEEKIDRDAVIKIKTDTIMRIPKIDLEIAVAPNVRSSSLWVLPGHYPSSAKPGQKGVAAYFGHRMYGKGRHFNRLNEVEKGDIIEVQRKGKIYTYLVDAQKIIEPIDLGQYVLEKTSKAKILLVTCHPIQTTGVPKYRIVVQGHLTDVKDVN